VVGLFAYLCFSEHGLLDLIKRSKELDKEWLIVAVLAHFLNLFIDMFLIYILTNKASNEGRYRFKEAFKSSLVGQFFSAVTPSSTGGQPMQVYVMSKQNIDGGIAVSVLIQKFLVYQTVLTTYSATAILIRFDYFNNKLDKAMWIFTMIGFIVQAIVILGILLFSLNKSFVEQSIACILKVLEKFRILKNSESKSQKANERLIDFYKGNHELFKDKPLMIKTYLLTGIQLLSMFSVPYFVCRSFRSEKANFMKIICAQSFIVSSSSLVPTPGSLGAAEGATGVFLSPFFTEDTIKSAVLITRLISYYLTLIISFPFSRVAKQKNKT
jgi:uncharacterized protein (TIRG00374 family)